MTGLPPFMVHVAGLPDDAWIQRCAACGATLLDNTAWREGRVAVPDGQPHDGPSWWPAGSLVATDKIPGSHSASMSYTVEDGRALADDERSCSPSMSLRDNDALREQVLAWIRSNKINPNLVTVHPVTLDGNTIRFTIAVPANPGDEANLDPGHYPAPTLADGKVVTAVRAVPLAVAPDEQVRAWLASDQSW